MLHQFYELRLLQFNSIRADKNDFISIFSCCLICWIEVSFYLAFRETNNQKTPTLPPIQPITQTHAQFPFTRPLHPSLPLIFTPPNCSNRKKVGCTALGEWC